MALIQDIRPDWCPMGNQPGRTPHAKHLWFCPDQPDPVGPDPFDDHLLDGLEFVPDDPYLARFTSDPHWNDASGWVGDDPIHEI